MAKLHLPLELLPNVIPVVLFSNSVIQSTDYFASTFPFQGKHTVMGLLAAMLSILAISQGRFSLHKGEEPGNDAHYIMSSDHCVLSGCINHF